MRESDVESRVLAALRASENEAVYQSDLARSTGFSRSRVSEILSRLERMGVVRRTPLGKNLRVSLRSAVERKGEGRRDAKTLRLGLTRAAEYPFVIPFRRFLKEEADIRLEIRIYENGVDVMRDLSSLNLDLGIAPLLTTFMFYSLGAPISIAAPAGSGGSSIMVNDETKRIARRSNAGFRVASTKLSTMELLLRASLNEEILTEPAETIYASSPASMSGLLASRRADAVCIWEPYSTILEREGFRRLVRYSDLGEHICCVLSVGNHLIPGSRLNKLTKAYTQSVEEFARNPAPYLSPYSVLVGCDSSLLGKVAHEYSYPSELDLGIAAAQLGRAGVSLPSPTSISDAMLRL